MPGVFVPIVADASKLLAAFRKSADAADQFGRDLKQLGLTAEQSARKQVEAAQRRDARLRSELAAYRQIAAAAKSGSREQVAAANLATQAERRLSQSLAVTAREQRQLASSAAAAERSLGRSTRGAIAGAGVFRGLGRSIAFASGGFLTGFGLAALGRDVITQATKIQEETEKTGVVFGQSARQVQAWSKTLADSFGVSQGAALEAAGVFGNMLRPLGVGERQAAAMSKRLVELAADMASFNNASPAEVLRALQSGLAGQVRPLRIYGVQLSDARLKQEALNMGIYKGSGVLTAQQKVLAAYNLILKDTRLQQGDVARNTESLSVAQSKLRAALQNNEAAIGQALLPMLVRLTNQTADWLGDAKNQKRIQDDVNTAIKVGTGVVRGFADVLKTAREILAPFVKLLGGAENAATVLGTTLAGLKFAKFVKGFADIGAAAGSEGAAGEVGLLNSRLKTLGLLAAVPITITIVEKIIQTKVGKKFGLDYSGLDLLRDVGKALHIGGGGSSGPAKLTDADVWPAIMQGVLSSSAVEALHGRFVSEEQYQAALTFARQREKTAATAIAKAAGSAAPFLKVPQIPTFLSPAQQRAANLAQNPNDRAAIQAQATYDRNALAFLEKRRREGKVSAAKYLVQYKAIWGDLSDMQARLQSLDDAAAAKRKAEADKADRAAKAHAAAAKKAAKARADAAKKLIQDAADSARGVLLPHLKGGLAPLNLGVDVKEMQHASDVQLKALQKQDKALVTEINKIKTNLKNAVQQARTEIGGLFQGPVLNFSDEQRKAALGIPNIAADPKALLRDLQAQLQAAKTFEANLGRLRRRGAPAALINELRGQGLGAAPEVAALAGASKGTLAKFLTVFGQREKLAQSIGKAEMRAQLVTLKADRLDLRDIRRAERFIREGAPTVQVFIDNVEQRHARVKVKQSAVQRRGPVPGQRPLP